MGEQFLHFESKVFNIVEKSEPSSNSAVFIHYSTHFMCALMGKGVRDWAKKLGIGDIPS
jgi:hypothetical protein